IDAHDGRLARSIEGPALETRWMAGADSMWAASADGSLREIDVASGRVIRTLRAPSPITALAVSPDGRELAAVDSTGSLYAFDLDKRSESARVEGAAVAMHGWREATLEYAPETSSCVLVTPSGEVVLFSTKPWSVRVRIPAPEKSTCWAVDR